MKELAAAVCRVMQQVHGVTETGRNQEHGYKYASDSDLLRALQPAMAKEGLCLLPVHVDATVSDHGKSKAGTQQWRTDVVMTYLLLHTSGESVTLQAPGCGVDPQDKGAYKASTGALKYVLRPAFLVPTGEDAERDPTPEPEDRPTERRGKKAEAKPAPPKETLEPAEVEPFREWLAGSRKKAFTPLVDKTVEEADQIRRWLTTSEGRHIIVQWRNATSQPGGTP